MGARYQIILPSLSRCSYLFTCSPQPRWKNGSAYEQIRKVGHQPPKNGCNNQQYWCKRRVFPGQVEKNAGISNSAIPLEPGVTLMSKMTHITSCLPITSMWLKLPTKASKMKFRVRKRAPQLRTVDPKALNQNQKFFPLNSFEARMISSPS